MAQTPNTSVDAAKIIHDANSHLAVIWGYVQLLQQSKLPPGSPEAQWLEKISTECIKFKDFIAALSQPVDSN